MLLGVAKGFKGGADVLCWEWTRSLHLQAHLSHDGLLIRHEALLCDSPGVSKQ